MGENIGEKGEAGSSTSVEEASINDVEEAPKRLRISPVSSWTVQTSL